MPTAARCMHLQELHRAIRVRYSHRFSPLRQRAPSVFQEPLHLYGTKSRFASTSPVAGANLLWARAKNVLLGTGLGLCVWIGYLYVTDVRAGIHQWASAPSLRWIYPDAEEAHEAGTEALEFLYACGLHPRERGKHGQKSDLSVEVREG